MASTVGPVCPLSSIQPGFLRVVWSKALYSMRRLRMLRLRSALAFLISWSLFTWGVVPLQAMEVEFGQILASGNGSDIEACPPSVLGRFENVTMRLVTLFFVGSLSKGAGSSRRWRILGGQHSLLSSQ